VATATEEWQTAKSSAGVERVIGRIIREEIDARPWEMEEWLGEDGIEPLDECARDRYDGERITVADVWRYVHDRDPPGRVAQRM
jgi:hypothetical protein